ncbi:MAG: hypothetical protein V1659_05075 [Candidatus Woesearchaeota archaeon]
MFVVNCPKCKNMMKVNPVSKDITKVKKRCVYCGHTFLIHSNLKNSRIIKQL